MPRIRPRKRGNRQGKATVRADRRAWTQPEIGLLEEMTAKGLTVREMAYALNRTYEAVKCFRWSAGLAFTTHTEKGGKPRAATG